MADGAVVTATWAGAGAFSAADIVTVGVVDTTCDAHVGATSNEPTFATIAFE